MVCVFSLPLIWIQSATEVHSFSSRYCPNLSNKVLIIKKVWSWTGCVVRGKFWSKQDRSKLYIKFYIKITIFSRLFKFCKQRIKCRTDNSHLYVYYNTRNSMSRRQKVKTIEYNLYVVVFYKLVYPTKVVFRELNQWEGCTIFILFFSSIKTEKKY